MSEWERVRAVVETMDGPLSVIEISKQAEVSRSTADNELERLASEKLVRPTLVDGKKGYELNPVSMMFDEIQSLIEEHTQDELATQLADLKSRREQLVEEFGVESVQMFREQMDKEDLSAEELRDRQNIVSTWEAINTELMLVSHAIRMHQDVSDLKLRNTY